MITKYEITTKSQYDNYSGLLKLILLFIIVTPIAIQILGGTKSIFYNGEAIICIISSIPVYFLHKNYFAANKGDEMICDFQNKTISFKHNDISTDFNVDDIKKITHFMSHPSRNGSIPFFPWDNYNYCKILLMDGRVVIVTSLMIPKMNLFLTDMGIEEYKITEIGSFYSSVSNDES